MKKVNFIILMMALVIISSCKKDFLSQVPDDKLTIDQVFQRKDLSEQYLGNIYYYISYAVPQTTANPWEGLSDETDITYNRPDNPGYATFQMNLRECTASSADYDTCAKFYTGIRS